MKNVSAFLKRHSALLLLVLVLATVPAGVAFGKYVKELNVTSGISVTVEAEKEYTIDKNKMWTALNTLKDSGPLSVSFCKFSDVPAGAARAGDGIQETDSGDIGVYYVGTSVYIAPVNSDEKMTAPKDCSFFLSSYGSTGKSQLKIILQSVTFDDLDTSGVTDMSSMFQKCGSLSSVDVSGFDTSSVTAMSSMFSGCGSLTTLDLRSFSTGQVKTMTGMFFDCTGLTSLDISSFDTGSAEKMQQMFNKCQSLTSLDLSSFNTSSVTNMGMMFKGCTALEKIYVSTFDVSNVTYSDGMFKGCSNLVGGAGTTFSAKHVDKTYARIDGGTTAPGYFTDKNGKSTQSATGSSTASGFGIVG